MALSMSLSPAAQTKAFSIRTQLQFSSSPRTCSRQNSGFGSLSFKSIGNKGFRPLRASTMTKVRSANDQIKDINSVNPIIVIDNYDSFTYNLCQYLGELGAAFEVYRNDELTVAEIRRRRPRGILISPGPGTPQDSGISLQSVLELGPELPLFGVCMGLQCIGEAYGGKIVRSPYGVMHGKSSLVYYDEKGEAGLLSGLPNPFTAARYHSLVIEHDSFPRDKLEIIAWTEDGLIMAVRHKEYKNMQGVQFHPESIITNEGKRIVRNFISLIEQAEARLQSGIMGA
ncbi:anthranilate synthase beta subunit 2, chloroplastic isoform X1 [Amborella trichopoda]|uniref:anthranilate synthase beta subunit 2, chloroplastic isoform X1 n=1 Tax=Amborella trichopoda TaxID=13333 RepID=UPI0005D3C891|nr:anthranilate synthase beta subunit 2, chloroplastic isoform X1 [Amborella trichopoda]|eukprot:XP_011629225.1 anthranilate synthase beta subunit 2, chloroplastic isoform X1 [Amborella trichopoda]